MESFTSLFGDSYLHGLAARARSVDERLPALPSYNARPDAGNTAGAKARLKTWCDIAAQGDRAEFERRLNAEGYNTFCASKAIASEGTIENTPPSWARTFAWAVEAMISKANGVGSLRFVIRTEPIPFEDILASVVVAASSRLEQLALKSLQILEVSARTSLERYLLRKMSTLLAPALYERFHLFRMRSVRIASTEAAPLTNSTSHSIYDAFMVMLRAHGLREVFEDRPVLARLLGVMLEQWMGSTAEFAERASTDAGALHASFSQKADSLAVADVVPLASDAHNGGRGVMSVRFASGLTLVYKPTDLSLGKAWAEFINWLDENGAPRSTRALRVVPKKEYGWIEWVYARTSCNQNEASEFFERAGALLCLLYLLQGTDLHLENIITQDAVPVLIDFEALLEPSLPPAATNPPGPEEAMRTADLRLRSSVLSTGYLPYWTAGPAGRAIGIGGLNPLDAEIIPARSFSAINSDAMTLFVASTPVASTHHLPIVNGIQASVGDYLEPFVAGFRAMYRFIERSKRAITEIEGALSGFRSKRVRVILQITQLYGLILRRSQELTRLSSGFDWSVQFDLLARLANWENSDGTVVLVQRAERKALASMDIPYFCAQTTDTNLRLGDEILVPNYFPRSSYNDVVERIELMDNLDMEFQIALIVDACSHLRTRNVQPVFI
ncbi:MAG: type 2 lantipeptide synthetase LanM [Planctomycetota bacterium]|nr:type 2 lantipeptide synthetase LanM [Planctomycetota bacterium]